MALRDAVLAALLEGEASGYDLAKRFDRSVANFWTATPQQLYRELDRLAADGPIPVGNTPEEYTAFIKAEQTKWGKIVREANIRIE